MKVAFPLYAKILFWFFMNLVLLAVAAWLISGAQLHPNLDSLIAGRAGDRIQSVADLILTEMRTGPEEKWDEILTRFEEAYHISFYLFRNDGSQLAGRHVELPSEVRNRISGGPAEGPPPPSPQNPPPPPGDRAPFPPLGMPPIPPRQRGTNPQPLPADRQHPKMMLHTSEPSRYWVLVRVAGPRNGPDFVPLRCTLVSASDTIGGNGLFFDPMPWIETAAGAIFLSALWWLPLVRGITRSIRKMTQATEQIAEGRFDVRVADARRDELGTLGGAINQMAGRLAGFVGGQKRFLGDIAHELCSPLARAQMALGILDQRGDETQRAYVGDVREEIELMSSLVNELLSFSKAALGAKIKLAPVLLRPLIEKAALRESGDDASVKIDVPEDLQAMADPELLQRSLANLVRNALHYAGHAGPVVVTASLQQDHVLISVADSGPGVPPDALAQVFDPFYRVDPSRARETGGVGLGLAIVKTCVASCGGSVSARNRQPSGLEVLIKLGKI